MEKREVLEIDWSLTPQNAIERGLKWWHDDLFDKDAPKIAMKEIYDYVKLGYKLGCPNDNEAVNDSRICGVYVPLDVLPKEEF